MKNTPHAHSNTLQQIVQDSVNLVGKVFQILQRWFSK